MLALMAKALLGAYILWSFGMPFDFGARNPELQILTACFSRGTTARLVCIYRCTGALVPEAGILLGTGALNNPPAQIPTGWSVTQDVAVGIPTSMVPQPV